MFGFFAQEGNMEDLVITSIKQAIQDRYRRKYGRVTIDLDEVLPIQDNQARVQFTIRKTNTFVTRYYGTAAFQDGHVHLNVMSI